MVSIKGHEAQAIALICFYLENRDPSIMKVVKRGLESDNEQMYRTEYEFNGSIHVTCRSQISNDGEMEEVIIE